MKTELKDVLHLFPYVECYFYDNTDKKTLECVGNVIGVDVTWERGLRNPYPIRANTKRGKGENQYIIDSFFHWDYCTPLLRPLSDITDEELAFLKWDKNDELKHAIAYANRSLYMTEFLYLLQKHFDVFGLIESSQAIDKTTIKL